ncbi:two-component system regulatory protein YycI [Levilactobacillus bambusae]|uniref:Regulatory protein YycH-like domain-containing protein n=1 Tax=Levilactobacillus bambusae TaxID=2024736 RepID=A0A2V1MZU3_9LACO|nr:two-component system regulatory protein YycI [Levilactobacillus bambusae]PWG00507.1 hypothetical protein DCM90_06170 [Levilactobacillus bambusae]
MNFRRIEWIFLVGFIMIDIFLFVAFQHDRTSQLTSQTSKSSNANITVVREMKNDSISLPKLSTEEDDGYYISATADPDLRSELGTLQGQTARLDDAKNIISTFKNNITVNRKSPEKVLDTVVDNPVNILHGDEYQYSQQLSSTNTVVYVQQVTGGNVMSRAGEIRFSLNDNGNVLGYSQGYLANVKTLRERATIISQEKALSWLYQYNQIPNNAKVKWAKLGYTQYFTLKNASIYIPTWMVEIKMESGSTTLKKVNAFTGAIMSDSSDGDAKTTDTTTS